VSQIPSIPRLSLCLLAGAIPALLYALLVLGLDHYEREPARLLLATFVWGAAPAILFSFWAEHLIHVPLPELYGEYGPIVMASLVAPPVEEALKALGLFGIWWLARYELDGALDGVVYGSLVGFGFAMTENVIYFAGYEESVLEWVGLVFGRSVAFGFNHAMFAAITGVGFAAARSQPTRARKASRIALGVAGATLAHLFHNALLDAAPLCILSLVVDWVGVAVILGIAVLSRRRERQWLIAELDDEVRLGVLQRDVYKAIIAWRASAWRELRVKTHRPPRDAKAWRAVIQAGSELAFARRRSRSATRAPGDVDVARLRQELVSAVSSWRSASDVCADQQAGAGETGR